MRMVLLGNWLTDIGGHGLSDGIRRACLETFTAEREHMEYLMHDVLPRRENAMRVGGVGRVASSRRVTREKLCGKRSSTDLMPNRMNPTGLRIGRK
jgi:hypothetical protein